VTDTFEIVEKAPGIRCRPEGAGSYLLYCPKTDELHMVGEIAKAIFDLCDGRTVTEVVTAGGDLLLSGVAEPSKTSEGEVMAFLSELHRRSLIEFR
jgi:hypothetical protein